MKMAGSELVVWFTNQLHSHKDTEHTIVLTAFEWITHCIVYIYIYTQQKLIILFLYSIFSFFFYFQLKIHICHASQEKINYIV